jgi:acetylornithine deacetylase
MIQPPSDLIADVLARLVAFDTTSCNSNLPLLDYVEELLAPLPCRIERISDRPATKANLWITFGPQDVPGYVLSGHCDTVPVDGQIWDSDPFKLTQKDGRYIGRGVVDMKGFLAVCLAMAPQMAAARLKIPIHLAISYDEEVGCVGVRSLLQALAGRVGKPLGCFVGEPTNMAVVVGHKGKRAFRTTVRGTGGHSSLGPRFVNAVEWAARLIEYISVAGIELQNSGARDELYDVPHTTLLVSTVAGGTAVNIVPDSCVFDWEYRSIAVDEGAGIGGMIMDFANDVLAPQMQQRAPQAGFEFAELVSYPGLETAPELPVVTLAKTLRGRNEHHKVAFGTEAGLFSAMAGIPSVVIGPGSITQAHRPDEHIDIGELDACARFVAKLIEHCSH